MPSFAERDRVLSEASHAVQESQLRADELRSELQEQVVFYRAVERSHDSQLGYIKNEHHTALKALES